MILPGKNVVCICHTKGQGVLKYLDIRDMDFVALVEAIHEIIVKFDKL